MEIVGGFMVMMSIIGFFLAVVWLVMPFVVFAIKGKQDRTLEVLEAIEKRLAALETSFQPGLPERSRAASTSDIENSISSEHDADNSNSEAPLSEHKTGGY
jgi:hypothetical protein